MIIETIDLNELENKVLVVKLGTESRPATDADLEDCQKEIRKLIERAKLNFKVNVMVTHHAMEFEVLSK